MSSLIATLAERLTPEAARQPAAAAEGRRRAAVAVVLHEAPMPRVLLMQRAERVGDPWSGHISLPGGRFEPTDPSLLATAIRESHEELALDLSTMRLLGAMPSLHPFTSGPPGIEVTPFVFATEAVVPTVCGPEAVSAFWLPLDQAAAGVLDCTYTYPGTTRTFPSWSYEGHVIWGLTWRILGDVLAASR
ncbi:MAG TPA: CoA pyrophosphatase [Kofleriaceae bacterium]|nr:CoA pyrophosphatase [Kofleriaceae bacterium]